MLPQAPERVLDFSFLVREASLRGFLGHVRELYQCHGACRANVVDERHCGHYLIHPLLGIGVRHVQVHQCDRVDVTGFDSMSTRLVGWYCGQVEDAGWIR